MTQVERVAVSLPKTLVRQVEEIREHTGLNRSMFYRMALKAYLEEFPRKENKKLAQLYQEIHQTDQKLLHHFRQYSGKHLPLYQE